MVREDRMIDMNDIVVIRPRKRFLWKLVYAIHLCIFAAMMYVLVTFDKAKYGNGAFWVMAALLVVTMIPSLTLLILSEDPFKDKSLRFVFKRKRDDPTE